MTDGFHSRIDAMGGSMCPFILPGSRLSVERVTALEIRKGDVVCYIGNDATGVAHRVVRKARSEAGTVLYTRGDAQFFEEEVPGEAVMYVVRRVEHRYFSYNTDSAIGKAVARVALGEDTKTRLAKFFCTSVWRAMLLVKRAARGPNASRTERRAP